MGSATCACISAAVAPGQIADTLTTLTVKNGSSARPSRWYEKNPAAVSAMIRNRINAGWLTAQPDRLKRFIAASFIDAQDVVEFVIASEAKQSRKSNRGYAMDCFVAALLA